MESGVESAAEKITLEGCAMLESVLTPAECIALRTEIEAALQACDDDATALRRRGGSIYGARNVLDLCPSTETVWRRPALLNLLNAVLGNQFGLVRGLYFDKPPSATWSLPWHQDLTIAVRDNRLPSSLFSRPTRKAGVPHVEAAPAILEQMLTLRIHLDAATPENGPLKVLPGSHRETNPEPGRYAPRTITCGIGGVFAMRPLLAHCSGVSHPQTTQHRRILHLEFSGLRELPDGYAWARFMPGAYADSSDYAGESAAAAAAEGPKP